jgi:hypothetical protein
LNSFVPSNLVYLALPPTRKILFGFESLLEYKSMTKGVMIINKKL